MPEILQSNVIDKQIQLSAPEFVERNPDSSWKDYWNVYLLISCAGCKEGIAKIDGMIKTTELSNNEFNQYNIGDKLADKIYCQNCRGLSQLVEKAHKGKAGRRHSHIHQKELPPGKYSGGGQYYG